MAKDTTVFHSSPGNPDKAPAEVRKLVKQQLKEWESAEKCRAAFEEASQSTAKEHAEIEKALASIVKKLGISEEFAAIGAVFEARRRRVDELQFGTKGPPKKA